MELSTPTLGSREVSVSEPRDRIGIPALIAASAVSNVGNGITALAVPWFVLVTTGSAARTGLAGAVIALAYVVSGFLSGALVDRIGYKRASIFSDLLSGVTVAVIPTLYLLDVLEYWHLLVLVFMGAVFDAPGSAARSAMIPPLARRSGTPLERVNSARQIAVEGSNTLLGPLLAGVLISVLGAANVLYVDAATFALSMAIIGLLVRLPAANGAALPATATAASGVVEAPPAKQSYMSDVLAGLRFVVHDPFLRTIMPVAILYNFLFAPLFAVALPVFVNESLGGAGQLGLLLGGFGIGTAVSTLVYGAIGHRLSRLPMLYGSLVLMTAGFWILAVSQTFWQALVAMAVAGVAVGPNNALIATLIQVRVPEGMLGRVSALLFAFSTLAAPLGVFLGGFLIESTSYRVALLVMAVGTTIGTIWVLVLPELRRMREELETAGR